MNTENREATSPENTMPEELENSLEQHMALMKQKVRERAHGLAAADAGQEGRPEVDLLHLSEAIKAVSATQQTENASPGFLSLVPPVTWVTAILAIVFGIFGIWAMATAPVGADDSKGFLDLGKGLIEIAKIFAGAIVGSATAAVTMGKCR